MEENEIPMKENVTINYTLDVGDVVQIQNWGYGFVQGDVGKYVEVVKHYPEGYLGQGSVDFKAHDCTLGTIVYGHIGLAGMESFGEVPLILLNTKDEVEDALVGKEFQVYTQGVIYKLHPYSSDEYIVTLSGEEVSSSSSGIHEKDVVRQRFLEGVWVLVESQTEQPREDAYSLDHYNLYYTLTEKDIEAGKIKVDAYWVAKQWKTGSRDDSGALWHSLKTIARFGEKNDKAREIKALYNQAIALARIYDVEL